MVEKVKQLAEKRRQLPPGGRLKEDYAFQWANDGKVGQEVRLSELFGDKLTSTSLRSDKPAGHTGTVSADGTTNDQK